MPITLFKHRQTLGMREPLSANRTYYVRTDGSDNNLGLVNSAGGAFLTIQKAIDVVAGKLDIGTYTVTIQVVDGTYTTPIVITGPWVGSGTVIIKGNTSTPANVLISITSADAITVQDGGRITLQDFEIRTTTAGHGILAQRGASVLFSNLRFGAIVSHQLRAIGGSSITATGNYSITGGAAVHYASVTNSVITVSSKTVTLVGTPAFSAEFALGGTGGILVLTSITFSGSATGLRYYITSNSVCSTAGGGANYLPGSVAGIVETGGQYL